MKGVGSGRDPVTARGILISLGIGLMIGVLILVIGGIPETGTEEFWKKLCDAFTVPGILLTGAGLLSLVSDIGVFNGISYPVRKAFSQIRSEEKRAEIPKTYYDYVSARQENGRRKSLSVLWVGLFFLVIAGVFLAVYLSRYPMEII